MQEENFISIDSLNILLPFHDVKIISEEYRNLLNGYYLKEIIDSKEGYVVSSIKDDSQTFKFEDNGISLRFRVGTSFVKGKIGAQKVIELLINSKLLRYKYFDGISSNSIDKLLHNLNQLKIIEVSKEVFLNGSCSDIDFKVDFNKKTASEIKDSFYPRVRPQFKRLVTPHYKKGSNKDFCTGISCGHRADSKNPLCKVYDKFEELKTNSNSFYYKYLINLPIPKTRFEVQFRNKKDLLKYGLPNTLKELFNVPQDVLKGIMKQKFDIYIDMGISIVDRDTSKLTPADLEVVGFMSLLVGTGTAFDEFYPLIVQMHNCKVTRSRRKKRLLHLYNEFIFNTSPDKKATKRYKKFISCIEPINPKIPEVI